MALCAVMLCFVGIYATGANSMNFRVQLTIEPSLKCIVEVGTHEYDYKVIFDNFSQEKVNTDTGSINLSNSKQQNVYYLAPKVDERIYFRITNKNAQSNDPTVPQEINAHIYFETATLPTPIVTIAANGYATFSNIENPTLVGNDPQRYEYIINPNSDDPSSSDLTKEQTIMKTDSNGVQLTNGQTIIVRALSENGNYAHSAYSTPVTFTTGNTAESLSVEAQNHLITPNDPDSHAYNITTDGGVTEISILPEVINVTDNEQINLNLVLDIHEYTTNQIVYDLEDVSSSNPDQFLRSDIDHTTTLTSENNLPSYLFVKRINTSGITTLHTAKLEEASGGGYEYSLTPKTSEFHSTKTATLTLPQATTAETGNIIISARPETSAICTFDNYYSNNITLEYNDKTYTKDQSFVVKNLEHQTGSEWLQFELNPTASVALTQYTAICAEVLVWGKGASEYQWISLNHNDYKLERTYTENPVALTTNLYINKNAITGNILIKASVVEIWDGSTAATPKGNGTQANPYKISNGAELVGFKTLSSNVTTPYYYELTNNIMLNDVSTFYDIVNETKDSSLKQWGRGVENFAGHLNGNGYVICGAYFGDKSNGGLFESLAANSSITNLGLTFSYAYGLEDEYANFGALVNTYNSSGNSNYGSNIINCYNTGAIELTKQTYIGGLVGANSTDNEGITISNCYSNGTFTNKDGSYLGGIVGKASYIDINNCFNYSNISGITVGGIIGTVATANTILIEQNANHGTLNSTSGAKASADGGSAVGGIVGYYQAATGTIQNNINTGIIFGTNSHHIGGIAGKTAAQITFCVNMGIIFGANDSFVGGIVGTGTTLTNCVNLAKVFGGGTIAGSATAANVSYCFSVYEFQNLVGNTNTITTEKPNKSESTNIALDFNTLETKAGYSTTIAVETHFTKAFSSENSTLESMLEIYLN